MSTHESEVERDADGYRLEPISCEQCGNDCLLPDGHFADPGDCGHTTCSHEDCGIDLCYECRRVDMHGNDFCPEHDWEDLDDEDGNPPSKEGLDRLRSIEEGRYR